MLPLESQKSSQKLLELSGLLSGKASLSSVSCPAVLTREPPVGPSSEGFSTSPPTGSPCSPSLPGTLGPPSQRSVLRLCTPRRGCGSEPVLHSAHRRLPSPPLQTAARLCLCHPDPLQGNEQSYGRTCVEPWVSGIFFPHRPQTDSFPGLQRVRWKRKTFLLVTSPHSIPGVE